MECQHEVICISCIKCPICLQGIVFNAACTLNSNLIFRFNIQFHSKYAQSIEVPILSCSVPLHIISTYHPVKGQLGLKNIPCKCVAIYTRKISHSIKTTVECQQNIHLKELDKSKVASTGSARRIASNFRTSQSFPITCWYMVYITEKANETQLCPNNINREDDIVGHENFSFTPAPPLAIPKSSQHLLFLEYPKDGSSQCIWSIGTYIPNNMASFPREVESSWALLWKIQITHMWKHSARKGDDSIINFRLLQNQGFKTSAYTVGTILETKTT